MKQLIFSFVVVCLTLASDAAWKNLSDAAHYSGPKYTESDLAGKVVLVDCWGVNCPPCRALLPRMEEIWKSFKSKPFVLIGSHCQGRQPEKVKELVEKNKLTYPIYERAGLADEPQFSGLPFFYVVNHRGKIIFKGDGVKGTDREAIEAIVNALGEIGGPATLYGGVTLSKFKMLKKKLVLGRPIKSDVKKLQAAAEGKNAAMAEEAKAILAAIEESKKSTQDEIENLRGTKPIEALKLVKMFMVTFPEDSADYKAALPDLQTAAAEAKKSAAETKKNAKSKK